MRILEHNDSSRFDASAFLHTCPSPDDIWDAVTYTSSVEQRRAIVGHMAHCPDCAAAWHASAEIAAMYKEELSLDSHDQPANQSSHEPGRSTAASSLNPRVCSDGLPVFFPSLQTSSASKREFDEKTKPITAVRIEDIDTDARLPFLHRLAGRSGELSRKMSLAAAAALLAFVSTSPQRHHSRDNEDASPLRGSLNATSDSTCTLEQSKLSWSAIPNAKDYDVTVLDENLDPIVSLTEIIGHSFVLSAEDTKKIQDSRSHYCVIDPNVRMDAQEAPAPVPLRISSKP